MASEIKANKISPATGTAFTIGDSGDTFTLPSGATLAVASGATISNAGTASGFGKVLQVVQAGKNDVFSSTSGTWTDITGLSLSITPSSASNKVLILTSINMSAVSDGGIRLMRDATVIGSGTGSGVEDVMFLSNTAATAANNYSFYTGGAPVLDSPATTSSITYKIQAYANPTYLVYINRRINDTSFIGFSSITAMEIQG